MKKILFFLTVFSFFLLACNRSSETTAKQPSTSSDSLQTAAVYECPMKCDGKTYDKPGKCSVCGMDLIVKN